ncbi:hypothetical protein EUGRSUZ_G02037 [Eucalyptus grandis]|uniref:Uncharacterized protein n=2 Tax=Eucalyptus grandis TaxID=71139 RepID=A0ACC3K5V7_EUCGR|nr:hypothetical protein EUGRSUZ_G02037 [Eucalyptus grandis]
MEGPIPDIKKWVVLYPAYINSKKTIAEGRRIRVEKACENPTCVEIGDCCGYLKLRFAVEIDKVYPRDRESEGFAQGGGWDSVQSGHIFQVGSEASRTDQEARARVHREYWSFEIRQGREKEEIVERSCKCMRHRSYSSNVSEIGGGFLFFNSNIGVLALVREDFDRLCLCLRLMHMEEICGPVSFIIFPT